MALRSTEHRWGVLAKSFHWLMALGIIAAGALGLIMTGMERGMDKLNMYALHKSIGLTVLALFLLRVLWRFIDRRPADEPMPRIQRVGAHAVHGILYLFMLAMPLSGWLYNSASGFPLQWLKLFNLPSIAAKDAALAELAIDAHELMFWVLVAVFVAHVAGALYHHFIERDNTLLRMLPFRRLRSDRKGNRQ